jgi:selenide,water dikinase
LGTGIISTALKNNKADSNDINFIMRQMARLNRRAATAMVHHKASAATDITGFSLIGHAREMALGSDKTLSIIAAQVPLIPNALKYSSDGYIPGGLNDNRKTFSPDVEYRSKPDEPLDHLLYDPQTSGGLLISAPPDNAAKIIAEISAQGEEAVIIGEVSARKSRPIVII